MAIDVYQIAQILFLLMFSIYLLIASYTYFNYSLLLSKATAYWDTLLKYAKQGVIITPPSVPSLPPTFPVLPVSTTG